MLSGEKMIPRLVELYQRIDGIYVEFAGKVGLTCQGCNGVRCCTVDLTLHTSIEMHYLRRGFSSLEPLIRGEVLERCLSIISAKHDDPWGDPYRNAVCALNLDGKCLLYHHRPMICRLAGLPHFMVRPDGSRIESGGCSHYQLDISPSHPDARLDRTDFYRAMAEFEIQVMRHTGRRTAPLTVAETLGLEQPEIDYL
jgi:hypothetical protein